MSLTDIVAARLVILKSRSILHRNMTQPKGSPEIKVICAKHAKKRMDERSIDLSDIKAVLLSPSVTVKQANGNHKAIGTSANGRTIVVIYVQKGSKFVIVTTYCV